MRDALRAALRRARLVHFVCLIFKADAGDNLLRARDFIVELFRLAPLLLFVSLVVAQRPGSRAAVRGLHGGERVGRARGHGRVLRHGESREGHHERSCVCVREERA